MSDRIPEQFEYRDETELIEYPEYNVLNEELGVPPEYDAPDPRRSGFRQLIVSAFKGGGAVFCALALAGAVAASHGSAMGETSEKLAQRVETVQKPAVTKQTGYTPAAFKALWRGDPDGPHNYDLTTPVSLREASCTSDGLEEYVCLDCGVIHREVIPARGHDPEDPVHEHEVEATCSSEGSYEEVVYCAVCGEELSRESVHVPVQPHTPGTAEVENEIAPGCTEEGSRELVTCCVYCGEELSRETETIPATGHKAAAAVRERVKAATCTKTGSYDEVVYCSVCHEELSRTTRVTAKTSHTRA
ncbi:MAG: hypothetical protein J6X24_10080, partial [Firmicutes bacterium]|nr:hypothetical protein [Bacillota bacterium]